MAAQLPTRLAMVQHNRFNSSDSVTAIIKSVLNMENNETLVILGKGAETYQKINGKLIDYCDIDVVAELVK